MFDWYNVLTQKEYDDFNQSNLVSRNIVGNFEGIGQEEFMITKGNEISLVYLDKILPLNYNSENPYVNDPYAVYTDNETGVWLGFKVNE